MKAFTSVFIFSLVFGLHLSARTSLKTEVIGVDNLQLEYEQRLKFKVDSLLQLMTLDEKIGQLNQYSWNFISNDSIAANFSGEMFKAAKVGSIFNVNGLERLIWLQNLNLQNSRLKIPLIFAGDVGHGFITEFPIPLAESCSWDLELMKRTTRIAAIEASASGICWTFAPMVDLSRDPRWGRVQEGAGEDSYLASLVAAARVQGYQNSYTDTLGVNAMYATAKHFVAYGAAQSGRDYHSVDMSKHTLFNVYLPPFRAAIDAGVASVMSAFNDFNGIPCSASNYLLSDVLRDSLNFKGLLVSDYTSINELVQHGIAENDMHAAKLALTAGVDVDMIGESYVRFIPLLLNQGQITMGRIDSAVSKILELKFRAGLFENPYRYLNEKQRNRVVLDVKHLEASLNSAENSIVLLKNNGILPVLNHPKIAVVGPHSFSKFFISPQYEDEFKSLDFVGKLNFVNQKFDLTEWMHSYGYNLTSKSEICTLFPDENPFETVAVISKTKDADLIVAVMGEDKSWCGEGNSRSDIILPGAQRELLKELKKTGKPIILILFNGRPLDLSWENENLDAILEAWYPGMMGGEAICRILDGSVNPSAKLTMTFPRNVGQIPIFYNSKKYYSQIKDEDPFQDYQSRYLDSPNSPLYPFGYGLNYSPVLYSDIKADKNVLHGDDSMKLSIELQNSGKYDANEIVQLYVSKEYASITPAVKTLRKFKKCEVAAGQRVVADFELSCRDLETLDKSYNWVVETGEYKVWLSSSSSDERNFVKIKYSK